LELITIISSNHKEWVSIVNSFGIDEYSEDLVQEMYIRLINKPNELTVSNGKPNKPYIFSMLRTMSLDTIKAKNRIKRGGNFQKVSIDEIRNISDTSEINNNYLDEIEIKIKEESKKWDEFDRLLFEIYLTDDISMRDIAKKTGISLTTIFKTIKRCKSKIKDNCKKDYELLINQ
jgi:RNA polymerase sigma factor (sigma-70 family)